MNEKLFWWSPPDPTGMINPSLHYVDDQGYATIEPDPQYGTNAVGKLLSHGYTEISWRTARAMGAPV